MAFVAANILNKVKARMSPAVTTTDDDALITSLIEEAQAMFAKQWGITLDDSNLLHVRACIIYVTLQYDGADNPALDRALSNLYEVCRGD